MIKCHGHGHAHPPDALCHLKGFLGRGRIVSPPGVGQSTVVFIGLFQHEGIGLAKKVQSLRSQAELVHDLGYRGGPESAIAVTLCGVPQE